MQQSRRADSSPSALQRVSERTDGRGATIRIPAVSPGDVSLACRAMAWALVLPLLKHLIRIPALARLMHLQPTGRPRDLAREARIVTCARWAARLVRWRAGGNCFERSLIAYRYLGGAGADPVLVVGLRHGDDGSMVGHAWVLVDGRPAGESAVAVAGYTPVVAFAADASRLDGVPLQATVASRRA